MLRRSTTSSATTITVYAFGLEEHTYSGAGVNQGNTSYYSLAGRLIGAKDANSTVFYMTDTLGSILASWLSREHATRSARAKALNSASIL